MNDTTHKEAYVRDVLIPGMVARGQLSFTEPVPAGVKTRLKSVEVKPLVTNGFMLTIPFVVTVVLEREGSAQGKEAPEPETLHLIVKVSVEIGGTTRRHFACKFKPIQAHFNLPLQPCVPKHAMMVQFFARSNDDSVIVAPC
uniref:Uncharacterized protein n=1 Tax=Anopheles melas TaxID=34690 RepID=A0A182TDQ6_9DIPT